MKHRDFIKKNIDEIVSFKWVIELSCIESYFEIWVNMFTFWDKIKLVMLVKWDLIRGICHYEWVNGKKCIVYNKIEDARL